MAKTKEIPKIALGAWAWGNDGTFGGNLTKDDLRPVFDAAMKAGLNFWDTAYAYGMGASEKALGDFLGPFQETVILFQINLLRSVRILPQKMQ